MKQTTNYSLNKIELADSPPDITVLNPNFDKIDTELKNLSDDKAPNTHVSASATDSVLAHVKLSDSTSSTSAASSGVAATPKAVKSAYDLANTAKTAAAKAQSEVDALETTVSTLSSTVASNTTLAQKGVNNAATAQSAANNAQTTADSAMETANACLPLAGGTMTGTITMSTSTAIKKANASYSAAFYGGTSSLDSAHLVLYGKDSSDKGKFAIAANDGTNKVYLYGHPDGNLKWNDNDVITSAGGVMTAATAMVRDVDSDALQFHGGTGSANGSGIWLYGKDKSNLQGVFRIRSTATGENVDLIGYPNGTLKWNGANIVRSVNGVSADAAGAVDMFPAPDPSAQITLTVNTNHTITTNGFLRIYATGRTEGNYPIIYFFNHDAQIMSYDVTHRDSLWIWFPVKKGDKIKYTLSNASDMVVMVQFWAARY